MVGSFYFPLRTRKMVHTLRALEVKNVLLFESTHAAPFLQQWKYACATRHLTNLANSSFGFHSPIAKSPTCQIKTVAKISRYKVISII